jgi:hypothetical protein
MFYKLLKKQGPQKMFYKVKPYDISADAVVYARISFCPTI